MFLHLFGKECAQTFKSLTYYCFLAAIVFFYATQLGSFDTFTKPVEGQENSYGMKASTDEKEIMGATLALLAEGYEANSYTAYPIGFYKHVVLNEKKKEEIHKILEECTGLTKGYGEAVKSPDLTETAQGAMIQMLPSVLEPIDTLKYDRFLELMERVDDIIGGGTYFAPDSVADNARRYATYEDALKSYEDSLNIDKVSRGKARLFCDYMGILLGILPVFLAVTRCLRDKRSQIKEVIYAKQAPAWTIISSRYFATLFMVIAPIFLMAVMPTLQCIYYGHNLGVEVDVFAYVKYIVGWLLPTAAFSTAIGFFFTELTGGPAAILVQALIWMINIFCSFNKLVGGVGWNLIPRINSDQDTDIWLSVFGQMVKNRLFYSVLALMLLASAIFVYHMKRKGALGNYGKVSFNRKKLS